jgi:hypothetical protein
MEYRKPTLGVTIVAIAILLVSLLSSGPLSVIEQNDTIVTAEDGPTSRWHYDCSNTTGFVRDPDWNQPGWDTWVHSDGDLITSGDYIQFSGIPSASGWHGPVFVYDLGHTFKLSTLINFSITVDVDNTVAAQVGRVYVILADENGIGSVGNSVYDYLAGSSRGMYTCGYRRINTTVTSHGAPDPTSFSSVTGTFMMWVQDGEMMSEVPGYGQGSLGLLDSVEGEREIRYIVMTYGRYGSDPIMDVKIEDLFLEYEMTPDELAIDSPDDILFDYGSVGRNITWNTSSIYPSSYELYVDRELADSGTWDGSQIVIDLDELTPGIYNYTLGVSNTIGARQLSTTRYW